MTQLDISALQAMRDNPRAKTKPEWEPLRLDSLYPGNYLAADPSLDGFGLVLFEVSPEHRCAVHMAERFSTQSEAKGWEDTLTRAEIMRGLLHSWLASWMVGHDWGRLYAVHEQPPTGGGKLYRPEASVLGGFAFRTALKYAWLGRNDQPNFLSMVRRQDHYRLICGDGNADKKTGHAALKGHFDAIRDADELITNADKRDALQVAIFAAHRGF